MRPDRVQAIPITIQVISRESYKSVTSANSTSYGVSSCFLIPPSANNSILAWLLNNMIQNKMEITKMKKLVMTSVLLLIGLTLFSGCRVRGDFFLDPVYYDNTPPSDPVGVGVQNGDREVLVYWNYNYENDVAGYNVYSSSSYYGRYELIGSTKSNTFMDYGVTNGVTYYYAVTAYDYNGNESDLSHEDIYITPRPEGYNKTIFDADVNPNSSGYDFSSFSVVPFDDQAADFFLESYNGQLYLTVWDDTDIQDMGYTRDLKDIPFAPTSGWDADKTVRVYAGNTYVIWTWDNHFAKIRIKSVSRDRIIFDWAYQTAEGNVDLKPLKKEQDRKVSGIK